MSIFSNGPKGIVAAMQISYEKHLKLAEKGIIGVPPDPHHFTALYGALATRNQVCGIPVNEIIVWFELTPFLYMEDKLAVSQLSIYAAFREIPFELSTTEKENLKNHVNSAVIKAFEKEPDKIAAIVDNKLPFPWIGLLTESTIKAIQSR